jgi:SET family sugar efflux transporter-like MFS transporter
MVVQVTPRQRPIVRALIPLAVVFLTVGLSSAVAGPFLSLFLSTAVRASPLQVTIFLVMAPLAGVTASTLVGRLSDRRAIRRKLLIGASLAGMVGTGLTAFVRDYWVLLGLAMTTTALAATLFPQTFAYARQVLSRAAPDRAAMGISVMRTIFSIAWVGGPALAALLLRLGEFRYVYGMAAATYAVAALVAFLWLDELEAPSSEPEPDAQGKTEPDAEEPGEGSRQASPLPAASRRVLLLSVLAFTALHCPMTLGVQALPLFISTNLGGDVSDSGFLLGLCAALEIPLMLGLGLLTTRFRLRPLVLIGAGCGATYYAIATMTSSVGLLAAAQIVNATFIGAVSGLGMAYMQDLLPQYPGQATTLFTNAFPIGAMLAGPMFGLAQRFDFRLAYGMSTVLCMLGLVILFVTRPRPSKSPDKGRLVTARAESAQG